MKSVKGFLGGVAATLIAVIMPVGNTAMAQDGQWTKAKSKVAVQWGFFANIDHELITTRLYFEPGSFKGNYYEDCGLGLAAPVIPDTFNPFFIGLEYLTAGEVTVDPIAEPNFPLYHPQHVVRLSNKDGKAYFMVSQSRAGEGWISVLETHEGHLDPDTDLVTGSGVVGSYIWQDFYTKSSAVGWYNHPGKMALVGDVLVVAGQNWDEGTWKALYCGMRVGGAEDSLLFYNVSDPEKPKYLGKITATELHVKEIAALGIVRTPNGVYLLSTGGKGGNATWKSSTTSISPKIRDWTKIPTNYHISGQHGMNFNSYEILPTQNLLKPDPRFNRGQERFMTFDIDGETGELKITEGAFDSRDNTIKYSPRRKSMTRTLPPPATNWDANSLYVSEFGVPIVYSMAQIEGTTGVLLQMQSDLQNENTAGILRRHFGYCDAQGQFVLGAAPYPQPHPDSASLCPPPLRPGVLPSDALASGDEVHFANQYNKGSGGYLDLRGQNCDGNKYCVSTADKKDREHRTGTWKLKKVVSFPVRPPFTREGTPLRYGDWVTIQSTWYDNMGGFLTVKGNGCEENLNCVSTTSFEGSDSLADVWRILAAEDRKMGDRVYRGDLVHLQNQFDGNMDIGTGGYLDISGAGCEENLYCVSTSKEKNRDDGSGIWEMD